MRCIALGVAAGASRRRRHAGRVVCRAGLGGAREPVADEELVAGADDCVGVEDPGAGLAGDLGALASDAEAETSLQRG